MKFKYILPIILTSTCTYANDSTGFVGTGGVTYLKNKDIQMYSEDLFISKNIIKVDYQFKNLSSKDVTETVLFPLPRVDSYSYSDEADSKQLINSFKVWVNGKSITPQAHARAYMSQKTQKKDGSWDFKPIDVTAELKKCGLSNEELMNPWTQRFKQDSINRKFLACKTPQIAKLVKENYDETDHNLLWSSEIIYSWIQTFKANSMTGVKHQYKPLVGGSIAFSHNYEGKEYCMDQNFRAGLKKAKTENVPYYALEYILKTGANWAKPIQDFKLTVERDSNELVSFCWAGKVKKISSTQFQMIEKNFVPKQDFKVVFVGGR